MVVAVGVCTMSKVTWETCAEHAPEIQVKYHSDGKCPLCAVWFDLGMVGGTLYEQETSINTAVDKLIETWDNASTAINVGLMTAHNNSGWRGDGEVGRINQAISDLRKAMHEFRKNQAE